MHRLILLLVFHVFQSLLFSQEATRTVHYSTREGLLSDVTYSGIFDRNNYLWICTDRGLSRFDGTDFTHFTISEGLPDNDVIYVTEDGTGTIWAQPFQREVAFLEPDKSSFTNIMTIIPPDTVRSDLTYRVFALRDGGVGLLSHFGTIRVIRNKQWVASYRFHIPVAIRTTFLYENEKNEIIVVKPRVNVVISPNGAIREEQTELNAHRYEISKHTAIIHERNDSIDNIILFNLLDGSQKRMNNIKGLHRYGIIKNKLAWGNLSRNISYTSPDFKTQKRDSLRVMLAYAADNSDGSVQVFFTADEGIFVRTFHHQQFYASLAEVPHYFYLDHGQLKVADAEQNVVFPLHAGSAKMDVIPPPHPIFEESFGKRKLSYGSLMMLYQVGKFQRDFRFLGNVKDIYLLNDSIRYLATHAGVFSFNKNTLVSRLLYKGRTTAVCSGADGTLYIGTHSGLLELRKDGTVYDWKNTRGFLDIRITDLVFHEGVLWLATAGKGLLAICNKRISTVLNAQNGISRNVITAIQHTGNALFIGYYDGAQKITYSVKDNQPVIEKMMNLNTFRGEGIKSFFLWNEKLYAIGNSGVFVYDKNDSEPVKAFSLRFTRIMINNKLYEALPKYALEHGSYDFQIAFSIINFEQFPVYCRYRINDGKWNYTTSREIMYKNQGSGTSRITIQVLNNYGFPSDTHVLVFDIQPPFFERPGFLVTAVVVSIVVIFVLSRFWFRRRFKAEREALLKENKLKELELIALKAQINPHFVFNCLNSIKGLIYEEELEEADRYIDRFALLFRNTLEASFRTTHPVAMEMAYLQTYLELEQVSVKGRFTFQVEAALDASAVHIPPMLLQPYVENAVKHGMAGISGNHGKISVHFYLKGNFLICTVTDNGAGRRKSAGDEKLHTGKGIAITSRRAELYQIDTVISDNIPSGTIVTITVPLSLNEKNDD